ncbi:MAG TPA: ABC transporter ATP-binding protein [Candidatus Micrarchaeaceae archaeon]|nr:ABC transporter ATP-binding protein [Candidatus Micrarchaeaceae archaeon]
MNALLSVHDLRVWIDTARGPLTIVDGVSFDIPAGRVFGLAGESGSGKTMTALALLGLLPAGGRTGGSAILDGRDLLTMRSAQRRRTRGREVAMVFQDPTSSLHPMLTIERQLTEHLRYQLGMSRKEADKRAAELLTEVRIPDPEAALRGYPHQFSGGMRQRIQIAIALACEPRLLVADEPTTALDVTVQAGILRLLHRLCQEKDLAVMLITHDLGVLSALADTVTVMYAGRVVESGPTVQVMARSRHPYTRGLVDSLPHPEAGDRALVPIAGDPAGPEDRPPGCAFHPRCRYMEPSCATTVPPLIRIDDGREMACPVDPLIASLVR